MIVNVLDVKATHVNNPDCPMRIAKTPRGDGWYCVDCGFEIIQKRLEVEVSHLDFSDLACRK